MRVLDISQVIVPRNTTSWQAMMAEVTKTSGSPVSWVFRNTYFFDEDPNLLREEFIQFASL